MTKRDHLRTKVDGVTGRDASREALGDTTIPQRGIPELVHQRLGAAIRVSKERASDHGLDREVSNPLGCPVRRDPVTRDAPDFLRIGSEKQLEKDTTEASDDPVFTGALRLVIDAQARPTVIQEDPSQAERAERFQDVWRLQRVLAETTLEEDAAGALHLHQFALHQLQKGLVQLLVLREPSVATEVESKPVPDHGPRQTTDAGSPLEHRNLLSGLCQHVCASQASRSGAQHDSLYHGKVFSTFTR
jgi:hypothetical protein